MKKSIIPAMVLAGACISGCTTMFSSPAPQPIAMNYSIENGRAAGVIQVFDIGSSTVVQLKSIETSRPAFFGPDNTELKYQIYGQNAVLTGIHNDFRVVTFAGTSHVTRALPPTAHTETAPLTAVAAVVPASGPLKEAAVADVSTPIAAAHRNDSPEQLLSEIRRMKAELVELKSLISKVNPEAAEKPARPAHEPATTVIVRFRDNSDEFEPTVADRMAIRELALNANAVAVRAYTDSYSPTPQAATLAKMRGYAAKSYLVSEGVKPNKISVQAVPAGGFIADNTKKEGRAANRRVEINVS